ncbi:MAG: hypothetical protein PUB63_08295 [Clostridia bacterium]|nr:hypothetical protein [Clostridia bacterium]
MDTNRRALSDRRIRLYGLAAAMGGAYLLVWRLWLQRYMGSHFVAWPAVGYALATAVTWFCLPAALARLADLRLPAWGRALHGLLVLLLAAYGAVWILHLSGRAPAALVRILMLLQENPWLYALWGGAFGLTGRRERGE